MRFACFCKRSALRGRCFQGSGSLFGPGFPPFGITLRRHSRAAIKHSGTLGRNKLPLSSASRPPPTEQLTQARIDEALLISRHLCSIWMGFGGGIYHVARQPGRLEGGSDFIFRLFFKLCESSSVSASPPVLGRRKPREWVVNQQCFSKCMQALIITGRALF